MLFGQGPSGILLLHIPLFSLFLISYILLQRNEPSFELTFNAGGVAANVGGGNQSHIYGADDWDSIYGWMTSIQTVRLC